MRAEHPKSRRFQTPYGELGAYETGTLLAEAQNHRCCYCGVVLLDRMFHPPDHCRLTIEHVISRSRGGADVWDNLVAACRQCNAWRSAHKLQNGHEIAAIAWFYKCQQGEDIRPPRQQRRMAMGLAPTTRNGTLPQLPYEPTPAVEAYLALSAPKPQHIWAKRQSASPLSGTSQKRKKQTHRRLSAQEIFCGHDVAFGSNRLPNRPTPAPPVEGASLGSLWPSI